MSSACSLEEQIHECRDNKENANVINNICEAEVSNASEAEVIELYGGYKPQNTSESSNTECANHSNNFKLFMDNKTTTFEEEIKNMETWSTKASTADVVCLGATAVIVIIQLCVLVFYVFKDHEKEDSEK